jgi:hypothetical protein
MYLSVFIILIEQNNKGRSTSKRKERAGKMVMAGKTYSVDSIKGDDGIIIRIQFERIVVMMKNENSG